MISIFERQEEVLVNIAEIEANCQKMLSFLGYQDFDISITFCDADYIQDLNKRYRQKDEPTDILSFPMFDLKPGEKPLVEPGMPEDLGDLIIFPARVLQDALELEVTFEARMKKLLAHGQAGDQAVARLHLQHPGVVGGPRQQLRDVTYAAV